MVSGHLRHSLCYRLLFDGFILPVNHIYEFRDTKKYEIKFNQVIDLFLKVNSLTDVDMVSSIIGISNSLHYFWHI